MFLGGTCLIFQGGESFSRTNLEGIKGFETELLEGQLGLVLRRRNGLGGGLAEGGNAKH